MEGEECKEGDAFCFRHNPNSTASTSVSWAALPITSAYRVHQRAAFCPSFWLPQLASTTSSRIVEHNRSVPARKRNAAQQTFPKVALAAAPYLFQNRLPFVQRIPAFSSYLRSLSARASAPTYLTISSRSARLNKKTARYFSALDILCISSLLASSLQNCSIQPTCRAAVFSSLSIKTQLCPSLEARPCHTAWRYNSINSHAAAGARSQKKKTSQQAQHQNMLAAPPKRDMTMIYGYEVSVQHEYGIWI